MVAGQHGHLARPNRSLRIDMLSCPAPTARTACICNAHLNMQAAEKAAAQSDREINGYRIESISVTHDRHTHYQRQAATPAQVPIAVRSSCMNQTSQIVGLADVNRLDVRFNAGEVLQSPPWTCARGVLPLCLSMREVNVEKDGLRLELHHKASVLNGMSHVQAQILSYNSAPTPGIRDLTQTGGMRWMGSARGAQNVGSLADSGLVTSVSALTNTMVSSATCTLLSRSSGHSYAWRCPCSVSMTYCQGPGNQPGGD
jgi:hypothetical protein